MASDEMEQYENDDPTDGSGAEDMEIRKETVYLVVNDGCVQKVFSEREDADEYADRMNEKGAEESAEEYGLPKGSEGAGFMHGYDGGLYKVGEVEIPVSEEDDEKFVESRDGNDEFEVGLGMMGECTISLQEIRECGRE